MIMARNHKGDRGGRRGRYDETTIELPRDVAFATAATIFGTTPSATPKATPLMDLVHAFTFHGKLDGHPLSKDAMNVLRRYRMELRRSERFVLDDEAVRLTCDLSGEAGKDRDGRVRAWAYTARLPYDDMWIELSLHEKVKRFAELGTLRSRTPNLDRISPVIGYQLSRDDDLGSPSRWIARDFVIYRSTDLFPGDTVLPGMLAYVFDPEATELEPIRSSRKWRSPTLSSRPEIGKVPGRVDGELEPVVLDPEDVVLGMFKRIEGRDVVSAPPWLRAKLAVIVDPFWEAYVKSTGPRAAERILKLIVTETLEQAGVARWLIALLAAINAVPRDVVPVKARVGRRHVGANVLPYFQHRTLRLQLPRDDRIAYVVERVGKYAESDRRNAPRPWHQVRGHWRVVERGSTPGRRRGTAWCRHVPTATDEAGLGLCGRCGLLIRWIRQSHRGDPSVGIVDHTYLVARRKG